MSVDLVELEISVLDLVVSEKISFEEIGSRLDIDDFSTETNRLIFRAMKSLCSKGNPIDLISLNDELKEGPSRPDGGDWSMFLTNLNFTALPFPLSNLEFHVNKLKEAKCYRSIQKTVGDLFNALDKGSTEEIPKLIDKLVDLRYENNENVAVTLTNRKVTPREWLLEGLIPDRFPSIMYGAGGIGKSFLALYIGILACMGGQNFMCHRFPREPRNTLYVDFELDEDEQIRRAQQVSRGLNLKDTPGNLRYFEPKESLSSAISKLRRMIRTYQIGFMIIDSIGASGTDGESVLDVVNLLTELKKMDIATLVLDHQSKLQSGERYDLKTPFGSVYKQNLARSVFQLSKQDLKNNTLTLRLRHTKANFGKLAEDLFIDMSFEGDRVLFDKSKVKPKEDVELEKIWQVIRELENEQEKVLQKNITSRLSGEIGRDRVINLLKMGEGKRWDSVGGSRTELVYKTRNLENGSLRDQDSGILENDLFKYDIPEELF